MLVLSITYSSDLKNGLNELVNYSTFIIIPLIFLYARNENINFGYLAGKYVKFLLISLFILLIYAFYRNFNEGYDITYLTKKLLSLPVDNLKYEYFNYWYFVYDKFCEPLKIQPIYLGLLTNIGIVFLFFESSLSKTKFFIFKVISLFVFLTLIGSRWQLVIGVINLVIYLLFWSKEIDVKNKIFFTLIIITAIGSLSVFNPVIRTRLAEAFTYKKAFYEDSFGGTSIRIRKWQNALKAINHQPIFGYGIGDHKTALLNQYKKDKFYLGYYKRFNAHNQYLDTCLAVGLLGLISLISIFYYGYFHSRSNLLLFLLTNIYFLSFLTESMFSRQWGVISFPFFICLASIFGKSGTRLSLNNF
ncbi:MAG: O-antigen ligase family protein [Sediminicola sp.]